LLIVKDHPRQPIQVLESEPESPAARAGLGAGDEILSIAGRSTEDLPVDEARVRLAGAVGTTVEVQVRRARASQTEQLCLERTPVDARTVVPRLVSAGGRKIGVVRIRSFGARTAAELRQSLDALKAGGARALVLDLRNNGGGLVRSAVEVCSNFLPTGSKVVSVDGRQHSDVRNAVPGPRAERPVVVLINENSASAAEITAAAIHDAGLGTLVGARSFGKGTVQRYIPLGDGSVLKLTTAHYHTPSGREINGVGITPDVAVTGTDAQLSRAVELAASAEEPRSTGMREGRRPADF
jgi:carboxyl-terminal processing protease